MNSSLKGLRAKKDIYFLQLEGHKICSKVKGQDRMTSKMTSLD